jgi:biopolymer transport protein ExbD
MTIHEPGRRLMHAIPLKFVQHKVVGGGRRGINAPLPLTSMIDFLIVTVVFLLMTFDASGDKPLEKNVTLPAAENVEDMLDAPIVAVTNGLILTNGHPTGNTRDIESNKQLAHIEFPGVVVLEVDQDVQALVVKSVFQTAAFAGYPNVSFMVNTLPKEQH